jgi:hypothetical protein
MKQVLWKNSFMIDFGKEFYFYKWETTWQALVNRNQSQQQSHVYAYNI